MKLLNIETTHQATVSFQNFNEILGLYQTYLHQKPFPYTELGEGEFLITDMCVVSDKQATLTLKRIYPKENVQNEH